MGKVEITVVYFTTASKNTLNFIQRLDLKSERIPEIGKLEMNSPYILVFPTYGGGKVKGSVPKPVVDFIKNEVNRKYIVGIIGSGDRNYGKDFCLGARMLSEKLKIPLLYEYEIKGTNEDVRKIREGILKIQEVLSKNVK